MSKALTVTHDDLFWAKGHPDTIVPTKRPEDAGYDLYARFDQDYILIKPHETKMIPTDLHCAFSSDYAMILKERGSTGTKGMGIRSGVIDSGFRGKIFVPITNHNSYTILIAKEKYANYNHFSTGVIIRMPITDRAYEFAGDKILIYPYEKAICQAVMIDIPKLQPKEITLDELLSIGSERGQGVIGDSGK